MISSSYLRNIAIEAGEEILKIYQSPNFGFEIKEDRSPLTLADKLANNYICEKLKELYPLVPILSEENEITDYVVRRNWFSCFIIDPLDGTKEFLKRNGEFTVNIAYAENGEVLEGVVYAPAIKVLYYTENKKSYKSLNGGPSKQLPLSRNCDIFKVVVSRSHLSDITLEYIDNLRLKHPSLKMIQKGSSLKLCLVAEGSANIYPRLGPTMEWDTAAAHAIVKNVGARVYNYYTNEPLLYNKESLLNPYFIVER